MFRKTGFGILMTSLISILILLLSTESAQARKGFTRGGASSIGISAALMSPNQSDINSWIDSKATSGTKNLSSGYEFAAHYEFRFSGSMFALAIRPSYFTQTASGAGVEASVKGFTVFPLLKLYPLENDFIQFFFQIGIGYGNLETKLSASTGNGTYSAGEFGALAGLGAAFCFTESSCIAVEGNGRYLPVNRVTGTGSGLGGNISQSSGELEINSSDAGITLSGLQGMITYQYHF
jgi:opacity protein-like surface antigen